MLSIPQRMTLRNQRIRKTCRSTATENSVGRNRNFHGASMQEQAFKKLAAGETIFEGIIREKREAASVDALILAFKAVRVAGDAFPVGRFGGNHLAICWRYAYGCLIVWIATRKQSHCTRF